MKAKFLTATMAMSWLMVLASSANAGCLPLLGFLCGGGGGGGDGGPATAPEIDASNGWVALALLFCVGAIAYHSLRARQN